jgi:arsenate reductase
MALHLYGIRSCDSCRKARHWLEAQGIEYECHDIRAEELDGDRLRAWQQQVGWEQLLNRRSLTWRKIPSFDRDNLDADAAVRLIQAYPTVMKRPVLELGGDAAPLVGFDEDHYAQAVTTT